MYENIIFLGRNTTIFNSFDMLAKTTIIRYTYLRYEDYSVQFHIITSLFSEVAPFYAIITAELMENVTLKPNLPAEPLSIILMDTGTDLFRLKALKIPTHCKRTAIFSLSYVMHTTWQQLVIDQFVVVVDIEAIRFYKTSCKHGLNSFIAFLTVFRLFC